MRVRLLAAAGRELSREAQWYESQRPGVGERFQAAVEAAVSLLSSHPLGGAPGLTGTRSVRVRGFPFNVVYRVSATELLVVAIAPHRKRPSYWADRVR